MIESIFLAVGINLIPILIWILIIPIIIFKFRSLNKKSPFEPDKSHLHHFLEKKINNKFIWLVFIIVSIFPIVVLMLLNNFFISIFLSIIFYIILLNIKKLPV